jgi:hypothetical protein
MDDFRLPNPFGVFPEAYIAMQCEGNCERLSLTRVGTRAIWSRSFTKLYTGAINMKVSLAALNTACAVASSTFAGFDLPPIVPPHAPAVILA